MDLHHFIKGINYWPANQAMYWWKAFDFNEVAEYFRKLRSFHLNLVRIFLLWEDFQPQPNKISTLALDNLKRLADLAHRLAWLKDFHPDRFYDHPQENLALLFHRYKDSFERK